jgi:hypothetical protein
MLRGTSCAIPLSLLFFPAPALAQDAVDLAGRLIGRPYVWGAEGPDSFDCSGLTQFVFAKTGVELPRRAINQSQTGDPAGTRLRRGDLLFFSTDTRRSLVTHVGIYEGRGVMIDASKRHGAVRRDALDDPYWQDRFMFARRVSERMIQVGERRRPSDERVGRRPESTSDRRRVAIRILEEVAGVLIRRPR